MIYVIIWLACGIIAGMIASRKGDGSMGFILGVLLGPFGILIALFMKGNRIECPYCKELKRKDASVCPHCQKTIPQEEISKIIQDNDIGKFEKLFNRIATIAIIVMLSIIFLVFIVLMIVRFIK